MADIIASLAMRSPGPAPSSRPYAVLLAVLLSSSLLLSSCRPTNAAAAAAGDAVRHVRHKRTVSDFVEGLMNVMYFHSDPEPVQSTVIARITHLPATKVYKYVPVQTLKLSKLRARQIAEPKFKIKYPKKYSIKTDDSSLTLVKNDLPWTLHPLPPPLPTSKTIKLEVDKSMPWALHPLPPPVKTKTYSEYYWPDSKTRPKYVYRTKVVAKPPHRFNALSHHKYVKSKHRAEKKPSTYKSAADYSPPVDYGPDEYNHVDNNNNNNNNHNHNNNNNNNKRPVDYNNKPDDHKYDDRSRPDDDYGKPDDDDFHKPDDEYNKHEYTKHVEFSPVDFKQIDFKQVDYKHVDYKSPDYKTDFPKHSDEELHGGGGGGASGGDNDHDVFHHSFSHDDHDSPHHLNDMSSQSAPPSSADFVSHITIEPSIQIAAFSDTELQGDGSNRDSVSQADGKLQQQKCQCTINGHRHRRSADNATTDSTASRTADLDGSHATLHAFFGPGGGGVGHATDVQIVKSHEITDLSRAADVPPTTTTTTTTNNAKRTRDMSSTGPWRPIATGGDQAKKNDFRDESDKFRVDFGSIATTTTTTGLWDDDDDQPRLSSLASSGANNGADAVDDGHGDRQARKPDQGKNYHIITTVTKTSNKPGDDDDDDGGGDRGVGFSVRTPFSVSSFSSNIRHPLTEERIRFTDATSSPLLSSLRQSSSGGYVAEPLDFEQFGLKSALIDDKPLGSGRLRTGHFSRGGGGGFDDKPSGVGQLTSGFSDGYGGDDDASGFSGRLASHFSRDFGGGGDDDRDLLKSSKPFRYRSQSGSNVFNNRFKGSRASSDDSVLEYFQPVVIDFDSNKSKDDRSSKSFRYNNGGNDNSRYFGKSDPAGFSKFKRNQNSDPLRLPGGLHESNENLSRKMIFHPSTFDID